MLAWQKAQGAKRALISIFLVGIASGGLGVSPVRSSENRIAATGPVVVATMPNVASSPVRFFTISQVLAQHDAMGAVPADIQLVSVAAEQDPIDPMADPAADVPRSDDEPFGLATFRAPEGLLWTKWRRLNADLTAEAKVLEQCRVAAEECPSQAALHFLAMVQESHDKPRRQAIAAINRAVNRAIHYVSDWQQHGVPDLWSAPLATFRSGQGDCEDYAIAKYVALQLSGVDVSDLRLLLVRDRAVAQDHAVLGVRDQGRWLILDNRRADILEINDVAQFQPLFALDAGGVKLFAAAYVASTRRSGPDMNPAAADYW